MKKFLIGLVVLLLICGLIGVYMYNKPHKSIAGSNADISMTASDLFEEYSKDEANANAKFLDKIIEVEGVIQQISAEGSSPDLLLQTGDEMFGVLCSFERPLTKNLKVGEKVVVKGLCTGMLTDVVLIKCSIQKDKL